MAEASRVVVMPKTLATKARAATPATGVDRGGAIPRDNYLLQSHTVRSLRNNGQIIEAIRKLARVDGTVSTAVFDLVQVANSGYTAKAFDPKTHEYSTEGAHLLKSVMASFDTLYDYSEGFSDKRSMDAIVETGLREAVIASGVGAELVLDKQRLPYGINLVPYEQLEYKAKLDGRMFPRQVPARGDAIDLDIATFWVAEMHKEANSAYSRPMMEAALDMAFYFSEFIEDMRRVVRRAGHSRMVVKIISEKVAGAAPQDVQTDPAKLKVWLEDVRADVVRVVNGMEPEDALVAYDSLEVDALKAEGDKADYKELLTALSGMLATSLKSHPSILGLRIAGSQSLSNTESLVYLKIARAVQKPVEQVLSRALTLAVRMYGGDYYVKFEFDPINLRPEDELEAFKTMRQQRILEQLSLGFISDDEAAMRLGTGTRPAGAPPLSGTFFHSAKAGQTTAEKVSPNADPMGRSMQSDQPSKAGGKSQ